MHAHSLYIIGIVPNKAHVAYYKSVCYRYIQTKASISVGDPLVSTPGWYNVVWLHRTVMVYCTVRMISPTHYLPRSYKPVLIISLPLWLVYVYYKEIAHFPAHTLVAFSVLNTFTDWL